MPRFYYLIVADADADGDPTLPYLTTNLTPNSILTLLLVMADADADTDADGE